MADMHEGDVTCIYDPDITAVVASDNKALCQGGFTRLSALAQALLKKDTPVQGTLCFACESGTLDAGGSAMKECRDASRTSTFDTLRSHPSCHSRL